MSESKPYFSIIVPVYNAAGTLTRSLESLSAQTFRDFEVILVDDCSTDASAEILNRYVASNEFARVISHTQNRGVAAARNSGLDDARGEYICWMDADDMMAPNLLETIHSVGNEYDVIGWDWTLMMKDNGRYMRQADYSSPEEALTGMMQGVMRWNLWLWAVKRDVWGALRFSEGDNMGEDMMAVLSILSLSESIFQIHQPLYSYNAVNSSSISKQFDISNRRQIENNLSRLEQTLFESLYAEDCIKNINYLKLFLKLPLLQSQSFHDYDTWTEWFPEANGSAASNPHLPIWTKTQQWMASHRMRIGLWLYYTLIYKFVYGIIYK